MDLPRYGKCSSVALDSTFTNFLANRKRMFMVAEQLARQHTPITMIDELWYRVEAAWTYVPVHAIQSLFDSMPRHLSAIITARGGCFGY
ncbi:uncharacterized protein TNCV_844651 [Trichonephila clavipes]|uniref:Uncharacterized protein n=1 Tax=Trichonephila clavipes TaxID=2585209 RepID=A0A8X6WJ47_TRICX|nr:uncharacterized protein TNCV_844651 [Trichonephila clavipes]